MQEIILCFEYYYVAVSKTIIVNILSIQHCRVLTKRQYLKGEK